MLDQTLILLATFTQYAIFTKTGLELSLSPDSIACDSEQGQNGGDVAEETHVVSLHHGGEAQGDRDAEAKEVHQDSQDLEEGRGGEGRGGEGRGGEREE